MTITLAIAAIILTTLAVTYGYQRLTTPLPTSGFEAILIKMICVLGVTVALIDAYHWIAKAVGAA
ncbi:hypothetical protein VH570_01280 [Sphingobium sp. HT1-2]|uniref:hypothetical protein n=1 Tax=Sphingobium sp. HT1-2 TaxID=3111640 RepID=UPI003C053C15